MKLSKRVASKSKRVLLFGPPKCGKTLLAGKLAERFNVKLVSIENGSDVLFQLPEEYHDRIEVIDLPDTRSYPIGIETCLKLIKGAAGTICEAHGKWLCMACKKDGAAVIPVCMNDSTLEDIWVFDSTTQLVNSAIAHITKAQPEDYKLDYDDWGNLGKLMDTFFSHVQQSKAHIICISHETEATQEDNTTKLVPVGGTRNFSRNVAKYFGEVIYMQVKNKKHIAGSSTTYNGNIMTGSRSGIELEKMAEFSLLPIFTGEKPEYVHVSSIVNTDTPADKSMSALEKLRAKRALQT